MVLETPCLELGTPRLELETLCLELGTPSLELETPCLELGTPRLELETPCLELGTPRLELETPWLELRSHFFFIKRSPFTLYLNSALQQAIAFSTFLGMIQNCYNNSSLLYRRD
ncbi:hypothetical protein [Nostoc sp.]|uniref:hypothetical protein n=1 Tax=Nostoc sp. TaxID=1180 RepID=UPI002FFC15BF